MSERNVLAAVQDVHLQWGLRIPMRDGVRLNATLYEPESRAAALPAVVTLTPYIAQRYHPEGIYFASRGYVFLTIDVRGRGNSEGTFFPYVNEGTDGHDVIEWVAGQSFCNGRIGMYGASYAGMNQWLTAAQQPAHLMTIVPAASPFMGVDVPMRNNIASPYLMQWLTLVWGRAAQDNLFWDQELYWGARFRSWYESGRPFKSLDDFLGSPSPIFQEWMNHPQQDDYWDRQNPRSDQYAAIDLPILSITGSYDADQPGALTHYREHLGCAGHSAREHHHLLMGPWDHAGIRRPRAQFGGLTVGPESLIDLLDLHDQWYDWALRDGPRPDFLRKRVTYYVMGSERWQYADSLEATTRATKPLYLCALSNPDDVFHAGALSDTMISGCGPAHYVFDPRAMAHAELESTIDPDSITDQRLAQAMRGQQLVYHSDPFAEDEVIAGFFRLLAFIAIDQPDTDIRASVYEVTLDGRSILLTSDWIRARYRESLREERLVHTRDALPYDFCRFTFISRVIRRRHRLRLVIAPLDSIYSQRNFNSGGVISDESLADARSVRVTLYQDDEHPSTLFVPIGTGAEIAEG